MDRAGGELIDMELGHSESLAVCPEDLLGTVKPELHPGETLLWAGRPVQRLKDGYLPERLLIAIWCSAVTVIVAIAAVGWRFASLERDESKFAVPFCVMAAASVILIFFLDRLRKRRAAYFRELCTVFALTDQRAILWQQPSKSNAIEVITLPARSIGSVHRLEFPDGTGSAIFTGNLPHWEFRSFYGVDNVRHVEALARDVLVDPNYRQSDAYNDDDDWP